jgi:tight adherence protein C
MTLAVAASIAAGAAVGVCLTVAGLLRWQRRRKIQRRVQLLDLEWRFEEESRQTRLASHLNLNPRTLAGRLGARVARQFPDQIGTLATRVDRAGLVGGIQTVELLGWKVLCTVFGGGVGIWFVLRYGSVGFAMLILGLLIGWFGIDLMLLRYRAQRRRAILRDLPTIMDLLVLSLEAGMGLDRALRTVVHEYHSALSEEIGRVMHDVDLGLGRGEAFERMALRVGLEDLRSLSRAIVQSEELGVSLVSVMQTQSHEVRLSRRRAAEAEALRAPVKMLIPLVVFILPTLFMLLLGPVGLRAASAISGTP